MKTQIWRWFKPLLLLSLFGSLLLGGCASLQGNSLDSSISNSAKEETSIKARDNVPNTNIPRLEGKAVVELVVNGSPITIEVNGNEAPITAGNFVDLVEKGVYDGLAFHRVVKEPQPFVAQGGDPQGKDPSFPLSRMGAGSYVDPQTSQNRYIPLEIKLEGEQQPTYSKALGRQGAASASGVVLKHTRGAVAMARSQSPDSASSQFYIALADLEFLDGDYAVFGYVTKGMDAVDRIEQGDRIESAKVIEGKENLKK